MRLQIRNAVVEYGADIILENVCFEIRDNEKIAVVGRNGCGKTTLLKLISGDIEPANPAGDDDRDPGNAADSQSSPDTPQDSGTEAPTGSLADYGLSEDDVVYDLQAYYDKCRDKIAGLGTGSHSFDIPVNDLSLLEAIRDAYDSNEADNDLFRPLLEGLGAATINTSVYPVEIEAGRFVLRHNINMK